MAAQPHGLEGGRAPQTVPVRVYQSDTRLMVAAPLPGLEPADISVQVAGDRVVIHADEPGPRQDERDLLVVEWAIGPYHRELRLPHPVDASRTNATYGNGVLVLVLPKLRPGEPQGGQTEFRLEVVEAPRGQRIGHHGHDLEATTTSEHRRQSDAVLRSARGREASPGSGGAEPGS